MEIQKAGPRHVHAPHAGAGEVHPVRDLLCDLPGRTPKLLGQSEGHIGGPIPVGRITGPLQSDLGIRDAHLPEDGFKSFLYQGF